MLSNSKDSLSNLEIKLFKDQPITSSRIFESHKEFKIDLKHPIKQVDVRLFDIDIINSTNAEHCFTCSNLDNRIARMFSLDIDFNENFSIRNLYELNFGSNNLSHVEVSRFIKGESGLVNG